MIKDMIMIHKKRVTMKGNRQVPIWSYREKEVISVAEFLIENGFTLSDVVSVEGITVIYDSSVQPPKKREMVTDLTDKFWDYIDLKEKIKEGDIPTLTIINEEESFDVPIITLSDEEVKVTE